MKNVAIYCRVSTQQQTIDRQKEELLVVAGNNGWTVDDDYIFVDVISGFKKGEVRPEYTKLVNKVKEGLVECVLVSEFSRLARNAQEMLAQVQFFYESGVDIYFQKQNYWVRSKSKGDLGSQIMLHVLAVMSSYEIELFAERSISGKITKIQNGYGCGGDQNTYGYQNDQNKKIIVREDLRSIIVDIFEKYADGMSTIEIANYLNAHNVPVRNAPLIEEFKRNRKKKGLAPKVYKETKWKPNQVSKMFSNKIYIGYRCATFHKPDPTNPLDSHKRTDREILFEYKEHCEYLRIIPDELWNKVQNRLLLAHYNKNNAIKHDNLVKDKMKCGECGSNYSVSGAATNSSKNVGERKYACYGMKNAQDHPKVCFRGSTMLMWRVDGLIVSLSLKMFAENKIADSNGNRIAEEQSKIKESKDLKSALQKELSTTEAEYEKAMWLLTEVGDNVTLKMAKKKSDEFNTQKESFEKQIHKLDAQIHKSQMIIEQTERMQVSVTNLHAKMDELRNSKELVKLMVETMLESITVYRIHQNWNLLIVKYYNGTELWATIKAARYKKSETFDNPYLCAYGEEYLSWLIDNTDGSFSYNKETQKITYKGGSEIYTSFPVGEYTYEEMDKLLVETENIISFPLYDYEGQTLCRPVDENDKNQNTSGGYEYVDFKKHNDRVLNALKEKSNKNN